MFKKNALIALMIVVLLCSVNAVAAAHYSYITTNNCQGNFKIFNGNGQQTMNWDFGKNTQQRIVTDGWRRIYINPLGWGNPNTDIAFNSVPVNLNLYMKSNGGIGISNWC
ncbi:MAG: hypothetical protein ABFC34_08820 [Methanobacterium sp.]